MSHVIVHRFSVFRNYFHLKRMTEAFTYFFNLEISFL